MLSPPASFISSIAITIPSSCVLATVAKTPVYGSSIPTLTVAGPVIVGFVVVGTVVVVGVGVEVVGLGVVGLVVGVDIGVDVIVKYITPAMTPTTTISRAINTYDLLDFEEDVPICNTPQINM
ncbi:MAG: hypothetical protein QW360_02705 [Thermofilum sp.]